MYSVSATEFPNESVDSTASVEDKPAVKRLKPPPCRTAPSHSACAVVCAIGDESTWSPYDNDDDPIIA
eukprot:1903401-Rhodomonas_salina.1